MPHIILVVIQNASDNMDNHLMAIPADHIVTVYIPVTVDEVVHEAAIKFCADDANLFQKERIQFSDLFIFNLNYKYLSINEIMSL